MEVKNSFLCLVPTLVKSVVSVYIIGLDCRRKFGETYFASDGQCECELVGLVSCQSRKDVCYISLFIPVCGELKVVWKLDMVYQLVLFTQTIPQTPPKKKDNRFICPFLLLKTPSFTWARSDFAVLVMHVNRELG